MVLIIAEDAIARQVYGELFAMRGWDVVTAAGARDGLRRARDRRMTVVVLSLPTGIGAAARQAARRWRNPYGSHPCVL